MNTKQLSNILDREIPRLKKAKPDNDIWNDGEDKIKNSLSILLDKTKQVLVIGDVRRSLKTTILKRLVIEECKRSHNSVIHVYCTGRRICEMFKDGLVRLLQENGLGSHHVPPGPERGFILDSNGNEIHVLPPRAPIYPNPHIVIVDGTQYMHPWFFGMITKLLQVEPNTRFRAFKDIGWLEETVTVDYLDEKWLMAMPLYYLQKPELVPHA